MKHGLLIVLAFLSMAWTMAQDNGEISTGEITFVFLSNNVDGSIAGFRSSSSIDLDDLSNSKFQGSVSTKTLKSGNFLRDWSLKGRKYFNVDDYPEIRFESTSVNPRDNGFSVLGNLTIKETTKPITIDFRHEGKQLIGTTTLFSSDYGIKVKKKREDNKVSVKMVFALK